MPRKVALCAMTLCAALVSGCGYEQDPPAPAAQANSVITERDAVAQQHWAVVRAFQRAPLGFKLRLQVAVGYFNACSPGSAADQGGAGGEEYQIAAAWEPVGVPVAEQGGRLEQAVPVVEGALNHAGWSRFQPSASSGVDVVATRHGIILSLDADPANPAPVERDWIPEESYTVTGPCIPVTSDMTTTEFESVGKEYYGTVPTALPPIRLPTTEGTSP